VGTLVPMRRIAIIGPAAAGKSTLARRLSETLGIPAYHLDALYWQPGWTPTPAAEWDDTLRKIVDSDGWIVDGNFTETMRERLDAADTIVYLDLLPLVSTVAAIRRRAVHRWRPAPGTQVGSRPMFNLQLFRWIWSFPHDHRPTILAMLGDQPPSKRVVILRSRRQVKRFVEEVARAE
jgi:adenylate kinase family enzyme